MFLSTKVESKQCPSNPFYALLCEKQYSFICSLVPRVSLPFLFCLFLEAISSQPCEWSSQQWRANTPLMFNSRGSQIQSAEIVLPLNSVLIPNLSKHSWQAYCKSLKCRWSPAALINGYSAVCTETAVLQIFVCYASDRSVLQRSICRTSEDWCCSEEICFCGLWQTALCISASEPMPTPSSVSDRMSWFVSARCECCFSWPGEWQLCYSLKRQLFLDLCWEELVFSTIKCEWKNDRETWGKSQPNKEAFHW